MVRRPFWIHRIEEAWAHRSVIWLSGVRRAGKTSLAQELDKVLYFDCELPRIRQQMEDPEAFLKEHTGRRIVLDEIHRLNNPSELLKIAADHFPKIKILATGSSRLQASQKFRDTLTGRKTDLWLTPLNAADLEAFNNTNMRHRLLRGGLPPFFMARTLPERDFQEWMDSYWAKDIQELFRIERRSSFQKFLELLFVNSGSLFEATSYSAPCEVSRTTIANYLNAIEETHVAHIIRPFSGRSTAEIVSIPKVYAFDTGFVAYYKGMVDLRPDDCGPLWEHLVLNELQSLLQFAPIHYWRDKQKHEVDFVLTRRGKPPIAIECKWSAKAFEPAGLCAFRNRHPHGENWVVAFDVEKMYRKKAGEHEIQFMGLQNLATKLFA